MSLYDKIKPYTKYWKIFTLVSSGSIIVGYSISRTYKFFGKIINTNVLDREKKYTPEYIYIDDPMYDINLRKEHDKETKQSVGIARIWKTLKRSIAWRLIWVCHYGNRDQQNLALEQLAAFKNSKDWDYFKLAQALDMKSAVLLARTEGADLRYFLPSPIHVRRAALSAELLSFKFHDLLLTLQGIQPHSCIQHFLSKNFVNIQEQAVELDSVPSKPERISERDLCLLCVDALNHHLSMFGLDGIKEYLPSFIERELLPRIAELFLRNPQDVELDGAILRVLTILSTDCTLMSHFYQNGLIRELARLIRSQDIQLSSSAAVCLTNLSGECCYRPGLYLLYPIYRTTQSHVCDTLLVHGLRGGVFVTWRQRDRPCAGQVAILDDKVSHHNCEPCEQKSDKTYIAEPELRQVIEDIIELKDEVMLSNVDIVLQDIPEKAVRAPAGVETYLANKKRRALVQEEEDRCSYTSCWPKDWLPKDCNNLRILGVNYWSSLSDWLERCPLQTADIESRASDFASTLQDAGVGAKEIPIVWLAHSMGGLIVKQLLVSSATSEEDNIKKLSENTQAVIFFSTPHRGSTVATMPRAAAAVLWPSNDVRQLHENSPILQDLQKSFLKVADQRRWETISFCETKPTLVTAFKVPIHLVKPESADLGRGAFYEVPLDHLSICKPATRQSILYTTVLDVLQRVVKRENEVKHSNAFTDKVAEFLWGLLRNKAKEVIHTIDETRSNVS